MKPISLAIAGLHSFREKQEIDFEALCEGGVFGIFGPTGSGKSSILDAMTLALYGKVERASNNTQGILNHAENVLEVAFVFDLENAKGKQRYKVERTFKRTDEVRVKSGICRLTEMIGSEHIVLADKASDVNTTIQEIIGLTIDDFTRAVVLPQGKFAEFLSLKGAERRQMLQRLFQLEKYGDELARKIKRALAQKSRLLAEIQAEQLGLGDASDEAVKEASRVYKEIAATVEELDKALHEMEAFFEEQKKKWEWQTEKQKVEVSLAARKEEEPEIKEIEIEISLADQAAALKPLLDEVTEVEKALVKWQSIYEKDNKSFISVQTSLENSVRSYKLAREKKEKEHPVLLSKKEQGERALHLEESLQVLRKKLKALRESVEKRKEYVAQLKVKEERTKEIYQKALTKQRSLKKEIHAKSLPKERIEVLQHAFDKKQEILQLENKWKETLAEEQKQAGKLQFYKKEQENAEAELKKRKENLLLFFQRTETYYRNTAELTVQLDWLFQQTENYLVEKKKIEEQKKLQDLAVELTNTLRDGEACPVCGSLQHPKIDGFQEQIEEPGNESTQVSEKLMKAIQQEKQHNVRVKLKLEQLASELYQEINSIEALPHPILSSKKIDEWEKAYQASGNKSNLLLEKFHVLETEQKALSQDILQLQESKGKLLQVWRKWNASYSEAGKLKETYEEQWSSWRERAQELKKEASGKKIEWQDSFPDENYEEMEQQFHQTKALESELRELQERINKSVDFMDEKEEELKNAQTIKLEEEKALYQESLQREQLQKQAEEAEKEIWSIVGNKSVPIFLQEVKEKLELLQQYEQSSYNAWTEAQNEFHELDKKVKQSEQMLQETAARHTALNEKWKNAFENTAFETKEEVEKSLVSAQEKEQWKEKVQQYWEERKAMEKELHKLSSLIGEETLHAEEWMQLQQGLQLQKQKVREEIGAKSAAFQQLSSLKERHERYTNLEAQSENLTKETQQYQKLQAVFKGNSFVEYLAEEQLLQISREASERLADLTRQRYALELDSQGGFIIRDDANGGVRRPVSTLSGGETFLTSLALALSLSAQIQLRGEYPLQFFFLDEGFGTLDHELLDAVVSALEKLQSNHLAVGVISHVQELRARLPRRLIVAPAHETGKGSVVCLEHL